MRNFFLITAGEFASALEDWMIDNKCNPKTVEEWSRCMSDIQKMGKADYVGSVDDKEVKKSLKEDFNIKDLKEPNNENF